MDKHTPGPWKWGQAVQHNLPAPLIVLTDAGKLSRRLCVLEDAGTESDARLIAAAPALLAALRTFVDYYDQAGIGPCLEGNDDVDTCEGDRGFSGDERFNVRQARAAIAKAETK